MTRSLKELKAFKQVLHKRKTRAEVLFENEYRSRKFGKGSSIKAQKVIGFYIVDFCFKRRGLIVEIDGSIHNEEWQKKHDVRREEFLRRHKFEILRFTNKEVYCDVKGCVDAMVKKYPVKPRWQTGGNCSTAAMERDRAIQKRV